MSGKSKKTILILFLFLLALGLATGLYLYNKGPVDIKHSSAFSVNAIDLYTSYRNDSITAGKKYTDKILAVAGEVTDLSVNAQHQQVVLIKTSVPDAYINCTFEDTVANIELMDKIIIKGICRGIGEAEPDLGIMADVYLTRCLVTKN